MRISLAISFLVFLKSSSALHFIDHSNHVARGETSQVVTESYLTWGQLFTDASWSSAITVKAPLPAGKAIRIYWPECEGAKGGQKEGEKENIRNIT